MFDALKKVERCKMPRAYYRENHCKYKYEESPAFSLDYMEAMMLFMSRKNELKVFDCAGGVSYNLSEIVAYLLKYRLIDENIFFKYIDTVEIVFLVSSRYDECGEKYLVPKQLVFYHSEKKKNYFLSWLSDGIEWTENTTSILSRDKVSIIINKTNTLKANKKIMSELISAYNLLFCYLKCSVLAMANHKGYYSFIKNISAFVAKEANKKYFVAYLEQYFSLRTEKRDLYPLVYSVKTFQRLYENLLSSECMSIKIYGESFNSINSWCKNALNYEMDDIITYKNRFDFFFLLSKSIIKDWDFDNCRLWLLKGDSFSNSIVLLGKGNMKLDSSKAIYREIVPWTENLYLTYADDIKLEEEIRALTAQLVMCLGIKNEIDIFKNITGDEVLDKYIFESDHLLVVEWDEDDISEQIYLLLYVYGLDFLMNDLSVDGKTIDNIFFSENESVYSYDRVILYANHLLAHGKILVHFNESVDYNIFALIDNTEQSIYMFKKVVSRLIELDQIKDYAIFNQTKRPLFKELLTNIYWVFDGQEIHSKEEFINKLLDNNRKVGETCLNINAYLSRKVIYRKNISIYYQFTKEDGIEIDVKFLLYADDGESFSNEELLYKLHKKINQHEDVKSFFKEKHCELLYLSLLDNLEEYVLETIVV